MHKVRLYYSKGKLDLVSIILNDNKHFTADVRYLSPVELFFVLSRSSFESKILNEEHCKDLVKYGYYILVEKEIKINIVYGIYTYCYIDPKLYLVSNQ
jgi:hypothetical protein